VNATLSARSLVLVLAASLAIGMAACTSGGSASPAVTANPSATASAVVATGMQRLCQIEAELQAVLADIRSGSISTKDELMSKLESVKTQLDSLASRASSQGDTANATAAQDAASAVGDLEDALRGVSLQDIQSVAGMIGSAVAALPPTGCPSVSPAA
jgi:signal recognition particle GTPase